MADGTYWSLGNHVAHYLLFATVGLLAIDVGVDGVSRFSILPLALVVAVTFAALTLVSVVSRRDVGGEDRLSVVREALDGRTVLLVMVALVAIGAVLRGYALGVQTVWFDEAITANAAIAVLERGRPTFPSGYTYWRGFPHTAVVAASMRLFGTGEAAARLPSVVFGVATIAATYWLGRQVGGRTVGLVAATLVTFATWEIAWGRQARMYQLFQLLFTLSLVLLLRVERTGVGDVRAVGALVAVGTLAMLTHPIGYVLLPVGVAYLGLAGVLDKQLTGRSLGWLLAGALVILLALELVGSGFSQAIAEVMATDVDYLGAYLGWLAAELHAFVYLGLVGTALTFYRGWYRAGTLLVLAVVPATWVLSFHTELFATRYLYFGLPVLFVWAAVTIEYVSEKAVGLGVSRWNRSTKHEAQESTFEPNGSMASVALVVAIGFALLFAVGGGFTVTPHARYDLGVNAPQPDFKAAYAYVNEHRQPGDVIVAGWTAPGLYYAGGVDYWLVHDLTGRGGDWTTNGVDRYAGAKLIRTEGKLTTVIEAHERGWIVVDEIALARQSEETRAAIQNETHRRMDFRGVTVFSWAGGR